MSARRNLRVFIAVAGLLLLATAVAWLLIVERRRGAEGDSLVRSAPQASNDPTFAQDPSSRERPPLLPDETRVAAGEREAPSFDVVRIEPTGEAVIAGRGARGVLMRLLRDGETYAETVANDAGFFVFVLPSIPPGAQQLVLHAIGPDGTHASREAVTVFLHGDGHTKPLVTLGAPDKPTAVLSAPATASSPATPDHPRPQPQIEITTVDANPGGQLMVSGRSRPGSLVRFYLNEAFIAAAETSPDGKVAFTVGRGVKPGSYRIRLDDVDPISTTVKTRAEVTFAVPAEVSNAPPVNTVVEAAEGAPEPGSASSTSNVHVPAVNTIRVTKRESLWRISSRMYGSGVRYTEIYEANQEQIRNPNLIYPGQLFVLPADAQSSVERKR